MKPGDRAGWLPAAGLAVAPVLLRPVSDPDLWWHLSAGRWMAEHLRIPAADWLSFTRGGRPWTDFEWLSQAIFWSGWSAAGGAGLWVLKAAGLAGIAALVDRRLNRLGLSRFWRAVGLGFWVAAVIPRSNLRTEMFSLLAFAFLAPRLEAAPRPLRRELVEVFLLFAVWANLHAGFLYGLTLIAVHCAFEGGRRGRLLAWLAAGTAGTFLNPYGPALYGIFIEHAAALGSLQRHINEWGAIRLLSIAHWPTTLLLSGWVVCLGWAWRKRAGGMPWASDAATALFALGTLRYVRLLAFFAVLGVPAFFSAARRSGALERAGNSRLGRGLQGLEPWLAGAVCAALFFLAVHWGRFGGAFSGFVRYEDLPVEAADFLAQVPSPGGLRMYNPWGWGGYLGFRLNPKYRVFQDGRYLFHDFLHEESLALGDPSSWAGFLDRHGVNLVVLRSPERGGRVPLGFVPPQRWERIYSDPLAGVFRRREARAGL